MFLLIVYIWIGDLYMTQIYSQISTLFYYGSSRYISGKLKIEKIKFDGGFPIFQINIS